MPGLARSLLSNVSSLDQPLLILSSSARPVRLSLPLFVCRGCGRFKGDKKRGPAKQRVRDDSAKPQISEVKDTGGVSKGKRRAGSSSTGAGDRGGLEVPSASKGKGPLGQAASSLPVTSLSSTTTVRSYYITFCKAGYRTGRMYIRVHYCRHRHGFFAAGVYVVALCSIHNGTFFAGHLRVFCSGTTLGRFENIGFILFRFEWVPHVLAHGNHGRPGKLYKSTVGQPMCIAFLVDGQTLCYR